jgi:hypothetical protein
VTGRSRRPWLVSTGHLPEAGRTVRRRSGRRQDTGENTDGRWNSMDPVMTALHDEYVELVNEAVAEDRMDLVDQLNDEYVEKALQLMLATAA